MKFCMASTNYHTSSTAGSSDPTNSNTHKHLEGVFSPENIQTPSQNGKCNNGFGLYLDNHVKKSKSEAHQNENNSKKETDFKLTNELARLLNVEPIHKK